MVQTVERPASPARRQRVPVALFVPATLGLLFLVLPLAGLLIRAPWATLPQRLTEPGVLTALRLSLQTATIATGFCVLLGVPLAWLLARVEFPRRRVVRSGPDPHMPGGSHPPQGPRRAAARAAVARPRAHPVPRAARRRPGSPGIAATPPHRRRRDD